MSKEKCDLIVLAMFWHNHALIWKMKKKKLKLIKILWINLLATAFSFYSIWLSVLFLQFKIFNLHCSDQNTFKLVNLETQTSIISLWISTMVTIIMHVAVADTNHNSLMAPIMHCSMNKLSDYLNCLCNLLFLIEYSDRHHCWDVLTESWGLCVPKIKIFLLNNFKEILYIVYKILNIYAELQLCCNQKHKSQT